ncbi:MAG: hypothetical protein OHK0029_30410 [Armatimonadaceae bacterium]
MSESSEETAVSDVPQKQTEERPPISDLQTLHLFYNPPGTLRLTVGEEWGAYSYPVIRLFQAAPLSMPGKYLSLQNDRGEEIVMVPCVERFPEASRPVAQEEIRRRYLTSTIKQITNVRTEFGITYWHVVTDRGERDFVVQSLSESCVWLSETHILLIDVDGNRFEILDRYAMDEGSKAFLAGVL